MTDFTVQVQVQPTATPFIEEVAAIAHEALANLPPAHDSSQSQLLIRDCLMRILASSSGASAEAAQLEIRLSATKHFVEQVRLEYRLAEMRPSLKALLCFFPTSKTNDVPANGPRTLQ